MPSNCCCGIPTNRTILMSTAICTLQVERGHLLTATKKCVSATEGNFLYHTWKAFARAEIGSREPSS